MHYGLMRFVDNGYLHPKGGGGGGGGGGECLNSIAATLAYYGPFMVMPKVQLFMKLNISREILN